MSTSAKTIIAVLVVLLVAALGYYWFAPTSMPGEGALSPQSRSNGDENTSLPSGSSTSDSALSADLQAIDSQMGGFDSDSASVSQGIDAQASDSVQ